MRDGLVLCKEDYGKKMPLSRLEKHNAIIYILEKKHLQKWLGCRVSSVGRDDDMARFMCFAEISSFFTMYRLQLLCAAVLFRAYLLLHELYF